MTGYEPCVSKTRGISRKNGMIRRCFCQIIREETWASHDFAGWRPLTRFPFTKCKGKRKLRKIANFWIFGTHRARKTLWKIVYAVWGHAFRSGEASLQIWLPYLFKQKSFTCLSWPPLTPIWNPKLYMIFLGILRRKMIKVLSTISIPLASQS